MEIIVIVAFIIIFIIASIIGKRNINECNKFAQSLEKNGYKYFFNGYGKNYISFDIVNRLIKIGNMKTGFEKDILLSDIINYNWKWIENNKAQKTSNRFVITLRDPDYPLHVIDYGPSSGWAEVEWAKLQSVFSNY